jgi:hypothetical protein
MRRRMISVLTMLGNIFTGTIVYTPANDANDYFSDNEATNHLIYDECVGNDSQLPDGLTGSMERHLRSRKRSFKGQTEEEVWSEMYRSLFSLPLGE